MTTPDIGRPRARNRVRTVFGATALALCCAGLMTARGGEPPSFPPLTTLSGSPRLPGKFVWADLVTDDVTAAQKFYGRLFGWKFRGWGGYVIATLEDQPVCGILQGPSSSEQPRGLPRWFGYISVENVSRAQKAVTKAGGRVLAAPAKFPKRGEQAIFADPEGALFGVIKSSSGDPRDFLAEPGDWIWAQLMSQDARKAAAFYRSVAGYEVIENTQTNRLSDFVLASEGFARATVGTIPTAFTEVKPHWLAFVRVKNVSESVALATQLGGKTLLEPSPELFEGRVAVIADVTGAAIGLLQWSPEELQGGR
jgi:predicted enzyme related to lactoylglutathione lyase